MTTRYSLLCGVIRSCRKAVTLLRGVANIKLGMYKGVILWESNRIPNGVSGATGLAVANTRRAVFLGAQAAFMGIGREQPGMERWSWKEKTFDYENEHGIACGFVGGLKRAIFNSESLGSIVISSYTANA